MNKLSNDNRKILLVLILKTGYELNWLFIDNRLVVKFTRHGYPNLLTLLIMLNSINASSAFIERFFSICGIIATQRNQNSNEDLLFDRAMLSANMKLLEKLVAPSKQK